VQTASKPSSSADKKDAQLEAEDKAFAKGGPNLTLSTHCIVTEQHIHHTSNMFPPLTYNVPTYSVQYFPVLSPVLALSNVRWQVPLS